MNISHACAAYLRNLEARRIRKSTRQNYQALFRQLEAFATNAGVNSLEGIDRDVIRGWREQWDYAASTHRTRLSQLKPFFSYAMGEGWISESPLNGVRSPKADARPAAPLSFDEMRAMLVASNSKPKERALLLLLRYSGLAIGNAATLARQSIRRGGELVLRRTKSGELVTILLPPEVLASLDAVSRHNRPHYFWGGDSAHSTVAKYWRQRLRDVAAAAGVQGFRPHRLRDTFAVELLIADMSMDDVSTLLGHRNVKTTEKYYAPWNQARRKRLVSLVREIHQHDPLLLGFILNKPSGGAPTTPEGASLATSAKPIRLVRGST